MLLEKDNIDPAVPPTQTRPKLLPIDQLRPSEIDAADPSLTIIEAAHNFGVLLAESCRENALGELELEKVLL